MDPTSPDVRPAGPGLVAQVRDVFTAGGALGRAAEGFRSRPGQTEMALAVARTERATHQVARRVSAWQCSAT